MSTFTWHPDQDDVYDGDVYGDTQLSSPPSVPFDKNAGTSFTMQGEDEDTLTLSQNPSYSSTWGMPLPGVTDPTQFNIEGGTFGYQIPSNVPYTPSQKGQLFLSLPNSESPLDINVSGNLSIQNTPILASGQTVHEIVPSTTFNIEKSGTCSIAGGEFFGGSCDINVNDQASMSVKASLLELVSGTYTIRSVSDGNSPFSFEAVAMPDGSFSIKGGQAGDATLQNLHISCREQSVSRFQAARMFYINTKTRAEDTASLQIACDQIEVDPDTVFSVGHGEAIMEFAGTTTGPAPFDFLKKNYPEKLFNFITNENTQVKNLSEFKFLNICQPSDATHVFRYMMMKNLIAINGEIDPGYMTTWLLDQRNPNRLYFSIFLKRGG